MLRMNTLHKVLISSLLVLLYTSQAGSVLLETDIWTNDGSVDTQIFEAAINPAPPHAQRRKLETPTRPTNYYLADRVINNNDFAKLANWGINTAIVDFDVNGSAAGCVRVGRCLQY